MRTPFQRAAKLTVLTLLAAGFLAACSSTESISDRRKRAERDRVASTDVTSGEESFWEGGEDSDDAALAEDSGAAPGDTAEAMAAESDLSDLDSALAEAPAPRGGRTQPNGSERPRAAAGAGGSGSIFDDLRGDARVREEMARHWEETGDEAFARRRYPEARDAYRRALDATPDNDSLRSKLNDTLALLGERRGERGTYSQEILDELAVERQLQRESIRRNIGVAQKALENGDLVRARGAAQSALDMATTFEEAADDESRAQARELLDRIAAEETRIAEERRQGTIAAAEEQQRREIEQDQARRDAQVQELLRQTLTNIRREDYRKAFESAESALRIDPDNRIALYWRQLSRERLLDERYLDVIRERERAKQASERADIVDMTPEPDFSFPPEDEWADVVRRSAKIGSVANLQDPEPIRRIKNRLESQMIQTLNFDQTPIRQVIDTFRTITNVNIMLDQDPDIAWEDETYNVSQPISNMSAMNALKHILKAKGLSYGFEENILLISTPEKIRPETVFEVYNVTDLLAKIRDFPAPEIQLRGQNDTSGGGPVIFTEEITEEAEPLDEDGLVELLKDTAGPIELWDNDTLGNTMQANRGQLFVTASPELHRKLVAVLDSLRQDSDLFVVIEARFIDVFDDFLEDIGIDSRALGLVNNLGTPFGNVINDNSTGGSDIGIVESGDPDDINLVQGLERWAGRVQHIVDGFSGTIRGNRLNAGNGLDGGTFQATWLEPFQVNVILRLVQEKQDVRQLTAPVVTAHNNQRVYVSVVTQRAYIADYELVSGGTGFSIIEVADPVVQTFQEGVILDVDPTISHDKKYVTLDVRPTLATLIGGVISTINISLGSFTNVAFQVPIGIPQIALQQSFTSVTVPNGGTVLLGGFKSMVDAEYQSYLPILGEIPILKNLARRKATLAEKRSLVILLSARIVDLRGTEERQFAQP